jgi:uncharacterized membrane protein
MMSMTTGRAGLALLAALCVCRQAHPEDLAKPYQVVTPRDDGIIATGISGRGDVVGFHWVEKTPGVLEQAPFFARGKTITYLPTLRGYTATFPAAVSDSDAVVGRCSKPTDLRTFVPLLNQAFLWDAEGGIRGLGVLEGDTASLASDITADGRRISGISVGPGRVRACIWDRNGVSWKASALPEESNLTTQAVVISDNGMYAASVVDTRPCLWTQLQSGQWKNEMIGEPRSMVPRAVNNSGLVVGVRETPDALLHAVIWTRARGQKVIEKPDGYVRSDATGVNNQGVVVGWVDGHRGSKIGPVPFVYENGRLRIFEGGGPAFSMATAINDQGQMTGVIDREEPPGKPAEAARSEPKHAR